MPFVTKNPSLYFSSLEEKSNLESAEPLHIGLHLGGSFSEERARDLVSLGRILQHSSRPIRCLWLRFREGDESLLAAFGAFGDELVGAKAIQSLVFEGKVGTAEVRRLGGFLSHNELRVIQFRKTDIDLSTCIVLKPFFSHTTTLKVLDMYSNPGFGDECVLNVLGALLLGGSRLETLIIGEKILDGAPDEDIIVSESGVASIASFVSKTPSISSITLRLRHLDDIGLGEISVVIKRPDCNVRRLDLSGNFGNSGVKIFAEALKTNTSLRTISFGCYKALDDVGGMALLNAVDPFSQPAGSSEWENVLRSNHTLQSIYVFDRPNVAVSKAIVERLQSITSMDPHLTLQGKCWRHIEKNIDDISHLGLNSNCMPNVLAFVLRHGTIDHLFRLIRSNKTPELFKYPSPEKARISLQIEKIERENRKLKKLLELERDESNELREEINYLRTCWFQKEGDAKTCCFLPHLKLIQMWILLVELFREPV
ncbi:hypothetical protein ACHAW5_002261 [Stephanodiscus triporus]|uniref:Uncharacterized protein n=1 Tax=Stephanodiscus triporus TaxID=2934178 RepID=A0ABD3MLD0_9STRA